MNRICPCAGLVPAASGGRATIPICRPMDNPGIRARRAGGADIAVHLVFNARAPFRGPAMPPTSETSYFPRWTLRRDGVIAPDERLPWPQTLALGLQHVVAMFGATVLAPLLMGFDPNVAILFSGIGTLIFFVAVGGRVPSYLGSSFSFIAVVIAATGYAGTGPNTNIGVALGGIIAAGVLYTVIGVVVMNAGYRWIERLMPPVVTGSVVAVIGLNLAPIAVKGISGGALDTWVGIATILAVGLVAVRAPGLARRLPILLGGIAGYLLYALLANGLGFGKPIDFIGDVLATIVAGAGGGTGVTTYAENIGVMAVTKIYSTLLFVVAALTAIVLGFSPKFGAMIMTIPGPVLGGLSIVVFGLITATGGRIWVQNHVDFSRARNLVTAAVTLTVGAGDLALNLAGFTLGGIGTATFGAILLYQVLSDGQPEST